MPAERSAAAVLALALAGLPAATAHAEREGTEELRSNPFSRPDILKPKPPPPPAPAVRAVIPPEDVELVLTATLVSENAPMVVVDGELIGIGERVKGLELIAVMEGRAVFARGARKFSFEVGGARPK